MKGFVVYPTYEIREDKAYVKLYGRLENGKSFVTINHFVPYFYVKQTDVPIARKTADLKFENTNFVDFSGNKVSKVVLKTPKEVPPLKKALLESGVACYEADIRFAYRFLIDRNIKGGIEIDGKHEEGEHVDLIFNEPELKSSDYFPRLRVLSFDIETDPKAQTVFSISMKTDDFSKVLVISDKKVKGAEDFKDEKSMLESFSRLVREVDPDIITGWNVIDFDLNVLKRKFQDYKIPFALGRNDWECRLDLTDSYFITSKARFPGRVVIDGIDFMKTSFMKLPDYKLNTAAKFILGKEKLITSVDRAEEIERLFNEDKEGLVKYNLKDSELVLEILQKTKVLDLTILRTKLTGMQLDRVNASIASFDSLYLKELKDKGIVAPSASNAAYGERIQGGFVRDSVPGFYDNILVFDFKSLYPSVIQTFNIDPANFVEHKDIGKYKTGELIKAPNGAHFRNTDGILPNLLAKLWKARDEAKKRKDKIASNAIKITMNSMFGVLANPNCRFYSRDVANAITHFGQYIIKLTAQKAEELGHEVIYGDTDSIFIKLGQDGDVKKIGQDIQEYINKFYVAYVKKNYNRVSRLELEFEKVYKKFFMPRIRGSETGAKKRYAGIIEKDGKDEMDFVGLEFVRSDWTELAKLFQSELLRKVFDGKEAAGYIKDFVKDLEAKKFDDKLVYRKWIRKPVSEYTKTTPPHIQAARKIGMTKTGLMKYVMTVDGPEADGHVKHKIDYEHYLKKQIRPIADSILGLLGKNFDDIVLGKQKSLMDF